uniref:(California timema) hypothetical protein n=1 Tax=Timema californicum TaxID=61474 RepID=A0A7R9JCQ4_TIMCA|nr:unnamed protein product [Timema californicum]
MWLREKFGEIDRNERECSRRSVEWKSGNMADKAVGEKWQPLKGVWPQHMAAILATLLALSCGIVLGWSTPAVPYLQEPHPLNDGTNATTMPITDEEGSWLGSLSAAGALLGAMPAGYLSDMFGRKRMLLTLAVPLITSWVMLILAGQSIPLLYLARVISGIGVGGATTITPVYNEEISELRTRATLSALSCGIVVGWSTPAVPYLQEPHPLNDGTNATTIPITDEEGSWLGSLTAVGALLGAMPAGYLSDMFGRKRMLLTLAVPLITGWVMLILAGQSVSQRQSQAATRTSRRRKCRTKSHKIPTHTHANTSNAARDSLALVVTIPLLYLARVISGIGVGGAQTITPIYNEEISELRTRGKIGIYSEIMLCIGALFAFYVGAYASYLCFHIVSCSVPIFFFCAFIWMPESPIYLLMKERTEDAEKSLRWLREAGNNPDKSITEELERMKLFVEHSLNDSGAQQKVPLLKTIRSVLPNLSYSSPLAKASVIVLGLQILQQLSGVNAVMYYTVDLFKDAGSSLSPYDSSIIVGAIQVFSSCVSSRIVDLTGRRPLLFLSEGSAKLFPALLGLYFYWKESGNVSGFTWIPLVIVNLYILTFEWKSGNMADKAVGEKWQPLKGVWPQHMAAILATLLALSGGIVVGWSTPAVPYLQEPHPLNDGTNATTIPITDEEGSWLGSLSAAGALLGAMPAGYLSDMFGRKRMLLTLAVPLITSWVMLILAGQSVSITPLVQRERQPKTEPSSHMDFPQTHKSNKQRHTSFPNTHANTSNAVRDSLALAVTV